MIIFVSSIRILPDNFYYRETLNWQAQSAGQDIADLFLVITILFYFLWLSEIDPAMISNTTTWSLTASGLYTNPVHVIDLSVFLPG